MAADWQIQGDGGYGNGFSLPTLLDGHTVSMQVVNATELFLGAEGQEFSARLRLGSSRSATGVGAASASPPDGIAAANGVLYAVEGFLTYKGYSRPAAPGLTGPRSGPSPVSPPPPGER